MIEADYLTLWAGGVDLDVSTPADPGVPYTFTVPIRDYRSGSFGDVDVVVSTSARYSMGGSFTRTHMSIPAEFRTTFTVANSTGLPMSITSILDASDRLVDLITIAVQQPSDVRNIRFFVDVEDPDNLLEFEWWSGHVNPTEDAALDSRLRLNFQLDSVELGDLLPSWHKLQQVANYGVLSVVSLIRESATYYETQLLGVCGALEALHRGISPEGMDYRDRCKALAAIPPDKARARVIPDIDTWAYQITKSRNDLAHGTEPANRKIPEDDWYRLYEPTLALLLLVILTNLGVSEEVQLRALEIGPLNHAVRTARYAPLRRTPPPSL
ncbi:hypothetical protein RhoFasSB10_03657 [Rhodococcus fascians]|uniref:HEPN domain-containing protein n=1 Tax=Rhodococcoides fascians TaxID=1828 RepID=UPI0016B0CCFF|nr:hypothetical protein [Rhodococcus fascians]